MKDQRRFPPAHGDSMTNDKSESGAREAANQTHVDNDAVESAGRGQVAADIERGVTRLLIAHGIATVSELPLPDGRRADVVGLSDRGFITVVEIKSSVADFRSDQKWTEYRNYCDRLFFAVGTDFPADILPADAGLILADRYGGAIMRDAPTHPLAAARRKAMITRFGRAAAARLGKTRDSSLNIDAI